MPTRSVLANSLVYSTDSGRICPGCREPVARCACNAAAPPGAGDARAEAKLRVSRETKGRGGKVVTLVLGLPVGAAARTVLAKSLKAACGSGGTVKEGVIEVQGDHVERVAAWLRTDGWTVLRAGR